MDIVVAVRIARRATAFAIAKPGVETRRLEGMGVHLGQIRITVAVTGGIGEEDLDPAAREDLMDLYRRWRRDRPAS